MILLELHGLCITTYSVYLQELYYGVRALSSPPKAQKNSYRLHNLKAENSSTRTLARARVCV